LLSPVVTAFAPGKITESFTLDAFCAAFQPVTVTFISFTTTFNCGSALQITNRVIDTAFCRLKRFVQFTANAERPIEQAIYTTAFKVHITILS